MSLRYKGGVKSAIGGVSSASLGNSGRWTLQEAIQNISANTWYLPTPTVEYLVVGGGGGGGTRAPGGGGAGGYRTASGFAVASGTPLTVTVGTGGASVIQNPGNVGIHGNPGTASVFSTISAAGGGGGAGGGTGGGTGGSGGGGGDARFNPAGGAGNTPSTSPAQGTSGGTCTGLVGGGGGGGATVAGSPNGAKSNRKRSAGCPRSIRENTKNLPSGETCTSCIEPPKYSDLEALVTGSTRSTLVLAWFSMVMISDLLSAAQTADWYGRSSASVRFLRSPVFRL